jgi:hypothetical protein
MLGVIRRYTAILAIFALAVLSDALADERPTAEERAKIEAALRSHGFVRWGEIERDDGATWEVDDAYTTDGRKFELKLRVDTLDIVKRESD